MKTTPVAEIIQTLACIHQAQHQDRQVSLVHPAGTPAAAPSFKTPANGGYWQKG